MIFCLVRWNKNRTKYHTTKFKCLIYPTFHIFSSYCQIHYNLSFQYIHIYILWYLSCPMSMHKYILPHFFRACCILLSFLQAMRLKHTCEGLRIQHANHITTTGVLLSTLLIWSILPSDMSINVGILFSLLYLFIS